ncbi:MAG: 3-oxoacyl-ACP synthase III family protein [Proteobacteria bacterium]|nr:3-oxoacyl-ACP synthase III family protein [Pseudomonadota bacterium]
MYINAAYHYLPDKIIPNSYYTTLIDLSDEWIYKRSGIRTRTKAGIDENTNTMSIDAVKSGLHRLPYDLKEVDLIVGATYTPYDTVATNAHAVQSHFAISRAKALSISSACSSFINAVEIVEGYFAINKSRRALVVASEHNTAYSDDNDKQSGYLWGDGAGVVLISKEKISEEDIEILDLNTTGLADVGKGLDGVYLRPNDGGLQMPYGKDIFVHACKHMVSEVENIVKKNGFKLEDIKHCIPHQANARIINNVAETLGLKNGQLIMNIEGTGNTGSASTIIALSQNWQRFKKGELIVITVFGGGYSSGAILLRR